MSFAKWWPFCSGLNVMIWWKESYIEWPTFCKYCDDWKVFHILSQNSFIFLPEGWLTVIIGSGNGLVLNRWQAITWTKDPFHWVICVSPGFKMFFLQIYAIFCGEGFSVLLCFFFQSIILNSLSPRKLFKKMHFSNYFHPEQFIVCSHENAHRTHLMTSQYHWFK